MIHRLHAHPWFGVPGGPWVDATAYPTISSAISAIGGRQETLLISAPIKATQTNLGVPPPKESKALLPDVPANVTLVFVGAGRIVIHDEEFRIAGFVEAGPAQIFEIVGSGRVRRETRGLTSDVRPEWWGAKGGYNDHLDHSKTAQSAPDDTTAIQRAIDFFVGEPADADDGGRVLLRPTGYRCEGTVVLRDNVSLIGAGNRGYLRQGTVLKHAPSATAPFLIAEQDLPSKAYSNVFIERLSLVGAPKELHNLLRPEKTTKRRSKKPWSTVGLHLSRCRSTVRDVGIVGFELAGLQINYGINSLFERVLATECGAGVRVDGIDAIAVKGTADCDGRVDVEVQLHHEHLPITVAIPIKQGYNAGQTRAVLADELRKALPAEVRLYENDVNDPEAKILNVSGPIRGFKVNAYGDRGWRLGQELSTNSGPSTTLAFSACRFSGNKVAVVVDRCNSVVFRDFTCFETSTANAVEVDRCHVVFDDCYWEGNAGHHLAAGTRGLVDSLSVRNPQIIVYSSDNEDEARRLRTFDVFHLDSVRWARLQADNIFGSYRAAVVRTTANTGRVWFESSDLNSSSLGPLRQAREDAKCYRVGDVIEVNVDGSPRTFVCIHGGKSAAAEPIYTWNASDVQDEGAHFKMTADLCVEDFRSFYHVGRMGTAEEKRVSSLQAKQVHLKHDPAVPWIMRSHRHNGQDEFVLLEEGADPQWVVRSTRAGNAARHMVFGAASEEISAKNPIRFAQRVETAHGVEIHEKSGAPVLEIESGNGNVAAGSAAGHPQFFLKVMVDGAIRWVPLYDTVPG